MALTASRKATHPGGSPPRRRVVVLGDPLYPASAALDGFEPVRDAMRNSGRKDAVERDAIRAYAERLRAALRWEKR